MEVLKSALDAVVQVFTVQDGSQSSELEVSEYDLWSMSIGGSSQVVSKFVERPCHQTHRNVIYYPSVFIVAKVVWQYRRFSSTEGLGYVGCETWCGESG